MWRVPGLSMYDVRMQRAATFGRYQFEEVLDLELVSVNRQLQEIDPNLWLARREGGALAVIWNGTDGQDHLVCVHNKPTREDIMALPSVIRARDNASPVNSRQSALERDIAKQRQAEIDRENAAVDAMMEEQLRLYSALRQDLE